MSETLQELIMSSSLLGSLLYDELDLGLLFDRIDERLLPFGKRRSFADRIESSFSLYDLDCL